MISVRPDELAAGFAALRDRPTDDLAVVERDGRHPEALVGGRADAAALCWDGRRHAEWSRGAEATLDRDPRPLGLRGWLVVIDEQRVAHVVGLPRAN